MMTPLFCSYIRRKDMDNVLNCLVTDSVGPGAFSEKFGKSARETFGYDYGFALRSPHTALVLALRGLGLAPGSAVAASPLAPAFHKAAVEEAGLQCVFLDTLPGSVLPDFSLIRTLSLKPSALILCDVFGILPDPAAAAEVGIPIIEDMTQALGASRDERTAGTFGALALYGLEQGSLVTAGGGALLCAYARRDSQVLRNLRESLPREQLMTDFNAALGMAQLRELDANLAMRRQQAEFFRTELAKTRHRTLVQDGGGMDGAWVFPVILDSGMNDARVHARKQGVETEPSFGGSPAASPDFPEGVCPNARSMAMRCLSFPVHQRIGGTQVKTIGRVLATLP